MLRRPTFRRHYAVRIAPGEGVWLEAERHSVFLPGSTYEKLAPLLNGRLATDEIVDRVADAVDPAEAYYALLCLQREGHVTEARGSPASPEAAFWDALGADQPIARSRLAATVIAVESLPPRLAAGWSATLARLGFRVGADAQLKILVTDDYLRDELAEVNRLALASRTPWLLVRPVGELLWLGPLFVPDQTCCWACLAHRLRRNGFGPAQRRARGRRAVLPRSAATLHLAVGLLATHLVRVIGTGRQELLGGAIVSLDPVTWEHRRHVVPRRPQCPACGDASLYGRRASRPVAAAHHRRGRERGRALRGSAGGVASLVQRAADVGLVSPITGIAQSVHRLDVGEPDLIHVYAATLKFPTAGGDAGAAHGVRTVACGGKGLTDSEARASVIGEVVERASGILQGDEPRVRGSLLELGEDALHPNACMLFSDRQYLQRARWNARRSPFNRVPVPFDPAAAVEWSPVWSLTRRRRRLLPTALLYYGYPAPRAGATCWADSNGCAAGPTREHAMAAGLLEVIERDAVSLWWYTRARRPALDPAALQQPYVRALADYYRHLKRDLWILDLTSDLGIPTYAAVSCQAGGSRAEPVFGFGAGLETGQAALRAVAEMNQMLAACLLLRRGESLARPELERWLRHATAARHPYLRPTPGRRSETIELLPPKDDPVATIRACRRVLEQRGLEVLVLDQSRPDLQIPVTKVLVPGLRSLWARFAPGRLYQVPLALRWVRKPYTENGLNPVPFFL